MAKLAYLELVAMLSDDSVVINSSEKKRLDHIIARKKALKEEDDDLNEVLDGVLREIRGEQIA